MNILGAIIRTDEIVGISALNAVENGDTFYYEFSIITKSTAVRFNSVHIKDVHIATKFEQQDLLLFKQQYAGVKKQVGLLLGEPEIIISEKIKDDFIGSCWGKLQTNSYALEIQLQKSKGKNREELLTMLKAVCENAQFIKETI